MVFQTYALYPHLTCATTWLGAEAGGTRAARIDRASPKPRAMLSLEHLLERGRASCPAASASASPSAAPSCAAQLFLFDEPLSNLDAALRVNTRLEIARLHRLLKATMIYVTHDQVEAMTLADRIVVLNDGGSSRSAPRWSSIAPANLFVAGFIGSPKDELRRRPRSRQARCTYAGRAARSICGPIRRKATGAARSPMSKHLGADKFIYVDRAAGRHPDGATGRRGGYGGGRRDLPLAAIEPAAPLRCRRGGASPPRVRSR
jgi:multiple sugar transport system ATP-binding protein